MNMQNGFLNILDKAIKSFYTIVFIFFMWLIFNSFANGDLYSTGGFIVYNTIGFSFLILLVIFMNS